MSLQGTVARPRVVDRRLALIEISTALAALHQRFYARLKLPTRPMRRNGVVAPEDECVEYKVGKRRVELLRERSMTLSGCDRLSDLGRTLDGYRRFIDGLVTREAISGDVFMAADGIRRDLHELCSIHRISIAFPDNAASRARKISARR